MKWIETAYSLLARDKHSQLHAHAIFQMKKENENGP